METGAVEFLNNLKRPLWSIYCTMPSHQSLLIDNIPKELSPEALLRYVLWKLSHTWRMNTKYGGVLIFEFDKSSMHFRFPPAPHSGQIVVETKELSKNFGEICLQFWHLKSLLLIISILVRSNFSGNCSFTNAWISSKLR